MLRWERRDRIVMVILMTWVCPYWPELRHEVIALIDTVTRVKVHWVRSYHLELMKWFLASGFKCRSCFLSHADPNILTWWVYVMYVCVRGGRIYVRDSGGAGVTSDTWWDQVSRGGHHSWPTPAQFHCPDTMITTAHHCPLWHVSCDQHRSLSVSCCVLLKQLTNFFFWGHTAPVGPHQHSFSSQIFSYLRN